MAVEMSGKEVREIRELLGMSQRELAEELGYDTHLTVWRWENGKAEALGPAVRLLRIWRDRAMARASK